MCDVAQQEAVLLLLVLLLVRWSVVQACVGRCSGGVCAVVYHGSLVLGDCDFAQHEAVLLLLVLLLGRWSFETSTALQLFEGHAFPVQNGVASMV